VFGGDARWKDLQVPGGDRFAWEPDSTYIRNPPFFESITMETTPVRDITGARVLALLGDSITTDHISPAGSIKKDSPAGKYLMAHGVQPTDFNSYGARRGNHEVMMRGTFANVRLRNQMAPGTEGGWTTHQPDGAVMTIYDAAMQYKDEGTALVVIAGKEYGSGSSRDWAAKGTLLLGVKAVVAESFERDPAAHSKLFVNPYGTNLDTFPLRERSGQSGGRVRLIFAGAWSRRKGCDVLEAAIRRCEGVELRHVGSIGDQPFPRNDDRFVHLDAVPQSALAAIADPTM
jgi:3-isopropylmalate dehydratase small subunit